MKSILLLTITLLLILGLIACERWEATVEAMRKAL